MKREFSDATRLPPLTILINCTEMLPQYKALGPISGNRLLRQYLLLYT